MKTKNSSYLNWKKALVKSIRLSYIEKNKDKDKKKTIIEI